MGGEVICGRGGLGQVKMKLRRYVNCWVMRAFICCARKDGLFGRHQRAFQHGKTVDEVVELIEA